MFFQSSLFAILLLSYRTLRVGAIEFDWLVANTSLWLSAATYCDVSTYLTRSYLGYSGGFIPYYEINNLERDVQVSDLAVFSVKKSIYVGVSLSKGFIGVMPAQNTIYIAFRGSTSVIDWLNNLDFNLTTYPISSCTGCEVNEGFLLSEQSIIASLAQNLTGLVALYSNPKIVVTGHSLGGALATLTVVDLLIAGFTNIELMNFGSPKVGNLAFAEFASNLIGNRYRVTRYQDIVPNFPDDSQYVHISGEANGICGLIRL
eukprot:scaffold1594_cov171-Ochromonas_danica.AAC.24